MQKRTVARKRHPNSSLISNDEEKIAHFGLMNFDMMLDGRPLIWWKMEQCSLVLPGWQIHDLIVKPKSLRELENIKGYGSSSSACVWKEKWHEECHVFWSITTKGQSFHRKEHVASLMDQLLKVWSTKAALPPTILKGLAKLCPLLHFYEIPIYPRDSHANNLWGTQQTSHFPQCMH